MEKYLGEKSLLFHNWNLTQNLDISYLMKKEFTNIYETDTENIQTQTAQ